MSDLPIIKAGTMVSVKFQGGTGFFHIPNDITTKGLFDTLINEENKVGVVESVTWIYIPEGSKGEFR